MSAFRLRLRLAAVAIALAAGQSGPAAAERIGPTIRELVEIADIEGVTASPDGRMIAFRVQRPSITANHVRLDWYVADLWSGEVRRVADGGTAIRDFIFIASDPPVWSPDSRFLFRRAMVDGAIGIWRTAVDGSGSRLIAGGPADVESLEAGSDGRSLFYVTGPTRADVETAERKECDDGILIDQTVNPLQTLYRGGWVNGRLASERLIGTWYASAGLLWREPRIRHRLDMETLRETGSEPKPLAAPVDLTNQPRAMLSVALTSGGAVTLVGEGANGHLDYAGKNGERTACNAGACHGGKIVALVQHPGTKQILFTRQDANFRQTLFLWDIASGRVREIAGGSGQLSGGRRETSPCAATASAVVCVEAGPVSPPRLVEVPLSPGAMRVLFDPNAEIRSRTAPAMEQLSFPLRDGLTATGVLLYRPGSAPMRAPLFVTYYYCPGYLRGGTGDPFPLQPLVDAGFVVACLNAFPRPHNADNYAEGLKSVSALVELLDRRGWIDPRHVGMGGFSMGSETTMWTAVNSRLLAAAAIVSPQAEPYQFWVASVRGRDTAAAYRSFWQVGSPDEDPARWKVISAALAPEKIKAPLLMQLPEQEFRGSMELYSKLTNSTTPVEMYAFPDEEHIKLQPRHQLAVYKRNLDWFRYWLQGFVDPDPALAAQYGRWDLLRRRQQGSSQ